MTHAGVWYILDSLAALSAWYPLDTAAHSALVAKIKSLVAAGELVHYWKHLAIPVVNLLAASPAAPPDIAQYAGRANEAIAYFRRQIVPWE